jgi:hypothetical protein
MEESYKAESVMVWFVGNNDIKNPDIENHSVYADMNQSGLYIEYYDSHAYYFDKLTDEKKPVKVFTFIPIHNINRVEIRMLE